MVSSAAETDLDTSLLRRTFGSFASGVTVIACHLDGAIHGMTANSFVSVALSPALALISVRRQARMHARLSSARGYGLSVLSSHQRQHAQHFAGQFSDGFAPDFVDKRGAPVLAGSIAWLVCEHHQAIDVEDHTLFIGRVLACSYDDKVQPLVYFGGSYAGLDHQHFHAQI
jgi:flavin reductase (DIM6/NTAB) family NADH-FMN oxidoreductase RutF